MPVKVEQINEYLVSDTVQSQKNKKWQQQKVSFESGTNNGQFKNVN